MFKSICITSLLALLTIILPATRAELFALRTEYQDPASATGFLPDNLAIFTAPFDYNNFQVFFVGNSTPHDRENFELVDGTLRWNASTCGEPSAIFQLRRGDSLHGKRGMGKNVHLAFNESSGRLTFSKAAQGQGFDEASWTICGSRHDAFAPNIGLEEHFPRNTSCKPIFIRKVKPMKQTCPSTP